MFTSQQFRINTGYGQTLVLKFCPCLPNAVILEVIEPQWDDAGNETGSLSIESVLEMPAIRELAVALYQANHAIDPLGWPSE